MLLILLASNMLHACVVTSAAIATLPAATAAARPGESYESRMAALERGVESPIQATIRVPKDLKPGARVPAYLVFGGFESAAKVLDLLHPHHPVVLASFDYPFTASRDLRFPASLGALPEAKRIFPRAQIAIAELVRRLRKTPEVDPERIVMIGASFGSPFAVAAAAYNPAIKGVVIVHGFGKPAETAEHVILRSWLPKFGWIARPSAWLLSRAGWLYLGIDPPEDYARELGPEQRVLMVTALEDSFIPREASDSLWQALSESKATLTRKLMATDHLMPGSERLIDRIVTDVESWLAEWKIEKPGEKPESGLVSAR